MIDVPPNTPSIPDEQAKVATHSEPDHPKPQIRGIRNIHARQLTQDSKKSIPQHLEKLRACESLDHLHRLAANLHGHLHYKPELSRSAFRQVLSSGCSLETLLQFLSDPSLNHREAHNLPHLLEWYISEPRSKTDSIRLHNWLRRHISLGMQSKKELQDLVERALHSFCKNLGIQPDMDLCQTILDGLSSSGADQISNLDGDILDRLLLLASHDNSWQNPELLLLGLNILEICKPAQFKYMRKGISSLLTSYLVSTSPDREICSLDSQVSRILNCLLLSSEIQASKIVASATLATLKRLGSSHPTCHLLKSNLNGWWSLLLHHEVFKFIKYSSEWLRTERALARHDIDVLGLYLKHLNDNEKCVFLLGHWFTKDVEDDNLSSSRVLASMKLFNDALISRNDTKCPFIFIFEYLGPRFNADRNILVRLFSLFNKLELQEKSIALFSYFSQSNISVDLTALAKDIIDFTSPNPQVAYTLYKIAPFLPLESCPSIAEMMINNPDEGIGVPLGFRDLRQKSLGVSNVYPRTADEIRCAQIELLNRMALAYAKAPHLYPRVAFRQVYQCYHLLLRKHGRGSLGVAVSGAFTLAGIVRPLQELQWVSTIKLKFILIIIRQIEGDEVATKMDELVYTWRDYVIGKRAEKAFELRLKRDLGLILPEVETIHSHTKMVTEKRRCEESRMVEMPGLVPVKPWGKLSGETNAGNFLRVRTARDLEMARAAQKDAMKKHGIRERALKQAVQELGEDFRASERADPVYIVPAEAQS